MDNDLIKQQIESAKKAYVSGVSKQQTEEEEAQNLSSGGVVTSLSRLEEQKAIMGRLKSLMDEASQTPRQEQQLKAGVPLPKLAAGNTPLEGKSQPFWAQTQTDIPPSERFAAQTHQQEVSMSQPPSEEEDKQPQTEFSPSDIQTTPSAMPQEMPISAQAATSQPDPPYDSAEAISAIRNEVISHIENTPNATLDKDVLERIEQLEGRVSKQQQDLTALLKLVRQIAARQKETPSSEPLELKERKGGMAAKIFWVLFIIIAGAAGWLYFMNPALFQQLLETGFNRVFNVVINLFVQFGLL